MIKLLKDCPFCGTTAVMKTAAGSYGYYAASRWAACANEPDYYTRNRPEPCGARGRVFLCQSDDGKIEDRADYDRATQRAAATWNRRA